ncbi:MAG: T9SS type A sorting domain-containing protein [Ignavibacteriaceae bacterium]|nr:T9SS type A sorting domain-containing protein [Ignavibacteriaceae bacterium]
MRIIFFVVITFILPGQISFARLIQVSTSASFKNACVNAVPGDTVELADGVYNNIGSITMYNSGTSDQPILIKAKNIGLSELKGDSYFDFRQCEYITVSGFLFTSTDATVIKLQASNNIRITRNTFRLIETESLKWIIIGGLWNDPNAASHHNRIDHNLFEDKSFAGNYITIDGSGDPVYQSSQYDIIDYNHFRNIGPRIVNEMETIRVGWSELSRSSGFTTIENNLFENCDGDPEIISVKTCDNIIRYNTFISSQGTLCLRHGDRTTVNGNYFFGEGKDGAGGIRFYGDDHKIYNNYFEGLTGTIWDAALTITNGDADYGSSTNWSKHFRPRNAVIAFNTFVNNLHNIEIGYTNNGNYTKPPSNNLIANNVIQGSVNELIHIYTQPTSMIWESNIMFPTDSAVLGITASYEQIKQVDPILTEIDSLWFIASNSPAIDSATGLYDYVIDDFNGQQRISLKDIGADEFSNQPIIRKPLTPDDVGPYADEIITSIETGSNSNPHPSSFVLYQNYPNPFNPNTTISFSIPNNEYVSLKVYDILGNQVASLVNENLIKGSHIIEFSPVRLASGIYFYRLQAGNLVDTKRLVLLK